MARPRAEQPTLRLVRRGRRYYARWWQNGAWHRVSTGTEDRREAQRALTQIAAGLANPSPPAAPTIETVLNRYLAEREGQVASHDTLKYAATALTRHLGDLLPEHLTTERCRFYARRRRAEGHEVGPAHARRKKPVGDGTVIRELVTLRAAFRLAVREKWIAAEPHVEIPGAPEPRRRWLTREEAAQLLDAAKLPHVRLFLTLALHTAARRGAILALRWDAVDFQARLIDLGEGAGNKGRAVVPINEDLLPVLVEAREGATRSGFVVEHGGEGVASVATGTRAAARRAGLPGVTPHTLRHTAATWMAQRGVPMREIALFLGHKSTTTTETRYAKHSPDWLRGAAAALTKGGK